MLEKKGRKAGEKIPQHRHCAICGKAVPIIKTLCSEECELAWERRVKRQKMYLYIFYGLVFLMIFVLLFAYVLRGG